MSPCASRCPPCPCSREPATHGAPDREPAAVSATISISLRSLHGAASPRRTGRCSSIHRRPAACSWLCRPYGRATILRALPAPSRSARFCPRRTRASSWCREGAHEVWWSPQSSKLVRPDHVGLGGFDSHALPPPALSSSSHFLMLHRARVLAILCALAVTGDAAAAQRTDTAAAAPPLRATVIDSGPRAPLTPKRAFLYSLAVPGSAQTILGRPRTAAFFVTVEALSIAMARKSANDLRDAKRHARDSLVVSYRTDPVTGLAVLDSLGRPVPTGFLPNDRATRVPARRTHFEDWIATLIFNHLISGAEAYVSAHLWELSADISVQRRD